MCTSNEIIYRLNNIWTSVLENLQKTLAKSTVILAEDYIIIPLYHSVAQIKREMQLEMYSKIWDYI